jgi:hypothetical protein
MNCLLKHREEIAAKERKEREEREELELLLVGPYYKDCCHS